MPTVDIYSKGQTDALLSAKANSADLPSSAQLVPSTSGASSGDVLTFDGSSVGWAAGGSGGSGIIAHTYTNYADLRADLLAHPFAIIKCKAYKVSTSSNVIYDGVLETIPSSSTSSISIAFSHIENYTFAETFHVTSISSSDTNVTDKTPSQRYTYQMIGDTMQRSSGSYPTTLPVSDIVVYY